MSIPLHTLSVKTFAHNLRALSVILGKLSAHCAARGVAEANFLQARLYPDMLPLVRQVQIAADFAKGPCARLAGVENPSMPDTETTIEELRSRLSRTTDFIEGLDPAAIDAAQHKTIHFKVGPQEMDLPGGVYLVSFALPNFYFHYTTAYALMRHNGLEIGKRDFMGAPS